MGRLGDPLLNSRASRAPPSLRQLSATPVCHHEHFGPRPDLSTKLERGATQDRDLFDWLQDVAITSSGLGLVDPYYKRNLDVVQQDRDGTTLRRWSLSRAWPTKFVAGEWDNESDENVIEQVMLAYDFFELVQ